MLASGNIDFSHYYRTQLYLYLQLDQNIVRVYLYLLWPSLVDRDLPRGQTNACSCLF